jgi:hypothetical protein
MSSVHIVRATLFGAVISLAAATAAYAQNTAKPPVPKHPTVCAKGVRLFNDKRQIPVPYDTLPLPPADGPIRVTSPEEAEAAELALRGRAGSVGATGLLVTDEVTDDGGSQRISRQATAVYVSSDSARAQQACK